MSKSIRTLCAFLGAGFIGLANPAVGADTPAKSPTVGKQPATSENPGTPAILAVVNGTVITAAEFEASASEAARRKFYHGKPPEAEVDRLMREVSDRLINRVLLLEEIKRQGIKADDKRVAEKLADYEKKYSNTPRWQQEREAVVASLLDRLQQDDALDRLEEKTRKLPPPTEEQVRAYYKKHPEKFTEPEKMRLSMILLEVDPSAPTSAWDAAEAQAGSLRLRMVEGGADFAELAKEFSSDPSAKQGGDLGYLHRGMLPEGIQGKVDDMKPGDISAPTRILQGFALFRYDAFQAPKHHDFATVKPRATDLLVREQQEQAWEALIARVRKAAKIEIDTQRYPGLAATAGTKK